MGQRELEVLGEELLDVGAADGVGLLDLNDLEDLRGLSVYQVQEEEIIGADERTWMEPKRAR